ncbi:MAG: peptidoglycan DD-metalloendopeptidase family protein [Lewinellaceae bacterium]|nr:peptidoglycan DD-metalloendopeptidase family protein [Saprospiraceae bacterium]MCB9340166.1 peptidoglycan DD-metalloendopeptidase family protein [Lewinellaceae bacterium]
MYKLSSVKKSVARFFKNKRKTLASIGAALGLLATLFYPSNEQNLYVGATMMPAEELEEEQIGSFPITVPTYQYGLVADTFQVNEGSIQRNQTLGSLLAANFVDYPSIERVIANCKDKFDISRDFKSGKGFTMFNDQTDGRPSYLVLEPNVYEYVVFHLRGACEVEVVKRPVDSVQTTAKGKIVSSLWEALTRQGVSFEAAAKMEDALQWSVDFSHTQEGDEFKLIYDQHFIEDKAIGSGDLHAAYYKRDGKEYFSFWFDNGVYKGYYDIDGRPAKKGFLKSPVKFTRISSNYNLKRFHPILKSIRPHLGTDYAAPYGTPIYAIGDGTIEEAAFTRGNGRYVKIKHDKVYQTQYLHMSKFRKGIRRGVHVNQGDVIGYVGSSGLATGPHVCFRFWKNGKQVNHLKEKLPQAKQLPAEALQEFYILRDKYLNLLMEDETPAVKPTAITGPIAPSAP